MSASFIVLLPSISHLLPIILDIIKSFYIEKPVISADNTAIIKILKDIIWIIGVSFLFLDKT